MEFSYSQTENFEMEKLSSDTGYFKKPVEINRGSELVSREILHQSKMTSGSASLIILESSLSKTPPHIS